MEDVFVNEDKKKQKKEQIEIIILGILIVLFLALLGILSLLFVHSIQNLEKQEIQEIQQEIQKYENVIKLRAEDKNEKRIATEVIDVPEESFQIMCTFDVGDCSLEEWRGTENKTIDLTIKTVNIPAEYKVYVGYVRIDSTLKAMDTYWDGKATYSIEDNGHRALGAKPEINDKTAYHKKLLFKTYNDEWYQSNEIYAEVFEMICDIVIVTPECKEGYVKSVYSTVIIAIV